MFHEAVAPDIHHLVVIVQNSRERGHRYDEAESAASLAEALLQDIDVPAERIKAIVSKIRNEFAPARRSLTNES
jgi:hypothetical protein